MITRPRLLFMLLLLLATQPAMSYAHEEEVSQEASAAVPPQSTGAPMAHGQSSNGKHGGSSHLAPRPPSERSQRPLCRHGVEDNSVPTRPAATGTAGQEMSENTGTFFEPLPAAYGSAIPDDTLKHIHPDDVFHPPSTVNTADFEQDNVAYVRRFLNLLHLNPCGDVHSKAAYWSAIHRNDALTTIYRPDTFKHVNPDDVFHPPSTVNTADFEQDNVAYVRRFLNLLHLNPCGDVHTNQAVLEAGSWPCF